MTVTLGYRLEAPERDRGADAGSGAAAKKSGGAAPAKKNVDDLDDDIPF